ncbi:hypothetical protein EWM64_g8055 [Hericium alpestre]|uniref:3-hydroxyacyl-CoA dehydrogenase NAD binding domain-containing protein n=1 Tax=Hericium alpestre TaxID=135208 RepID=A0A4Y9ZPH7_9AGAM|nr:hypothetical protein EWM64_g8055 [Hericium alpestre]
MAHIIAHGVKTLGVIGGGQMGLGIAYVAALSAKVPVLLHDRNEEQIAKSLKLMDRLLAKDVAKGKIQELEAKEARDRVTGDDGISGARGRSVVPPRGILTPPHDLPPPSASNSLRIAWFTVYWKPGIPHPLHPILTVTTWSTPSVLAHSTVSDRVGVRTLIRQ